MSSNNNIVSIIETRVNYQQNTFSIVFDSAYLYVEIADDDKGYPEGTFFITMKDGVGYRYAVVPCEPKEKEG